ncbi:MAG: hypothetical protein M3361_08470 [Candidatus Tectomicrobia bacterium]|nr:hypothetical protein [Candidatus Tectomicrobia bacterium]
MKALFFVVPMLITTCSHAAFRPVAAVPAYDLDPMINGDGTGLTFEIGTVSLEGVGSSRDVEFINRLYQGYRMWALDTADGGVIQAMRVS